MRRRRLLALGLFTATAGAAAVMRPAPLRTQARAALARWRPAPVLDPTAPTGVPTDAELDTLRALAALLLPSTAGPAADALVRRYVIDQAARVPGMLREYRRAVRLLDTSGAHDQPFAARAADAQRATLRALFPPYAHDSWGDRLRARLFTSRETRATRVFVVNDLLAMYFRSEPGWATVGYSHFPGVPAVDPLDYTRAPAGQPT
ncbi:MAG: hypothetical protein JNL48_05845 [Acidobacteria bacterium]|nr:hypothetical protein [Acidobacteriota bacterium]